MSLRTVTRAQSQLLRRPLQISWTGRTTGVKNPCVDARASSARSRTSVHRRLSTAFTTNFRSNYGAPGYFAAQKFSSTSSGEKSFNDESNRTPSGGPESSVDDTLNKLFDESTKSESSSWYSTPGLEQWEPSSWYHLSDQAIAGLLHVHEATGLSYGWTIVITTVGLRLVMFPLLGMAQQATSRMAHLQPELRQLQQKQERLGSLTREESVQFANQYKALFRKYQVNPAYAAVPLIQLPLFVSLFFGLQKMPKIFPDELSVGGMFWFPDLTVPDPLYILPLLSTTTLMAMFEINKTQVLRQSPGQQGQFMLNFFRVMGLISLPVAMTFDTGVVLMWATNSSFMMVQTILFQTSPVRRLFGIWEPPKPVPGQTTDVGITGSISNMVKRAQGEAVNEQEKIERHNQRVEAKKSFRMARERRLRKGITGKRNV